MKAVVIREAGGIDQLEYREVPAPRPGPGEVSVRLRAAAVNRLDIWVRQGGRGYPPGYPHVSGSDGAGEVMDIGPTPGGAPAVTPPGVGSPGVTKLRVGDRVVIDPWIACGACEACRSGETVLCAQLRIVGAHTPGTYAEQVCVPAENALPIPERLTDAEAAVMPFAFSTAWHALIERARLRAGESCLILAAGSGVGSAGIQIAKLTGARVFATASGSTKLQRARALGADETIDTLQQEFAEEAKRRTGGRGVDVVFEHVGPATFAQSLRALAPGGRVVTCGATTGPAAAFDIPSLYGRQLAILGSTGGTRRDVRTVLRLAGEGRLRPVIDVAFDLKDAARAQERMLARDQFGKIVLEP
jgi:NADPH:quinone reductase-like Zn-dependent oxidoreductase